jgi:hypothetical protein
LIQAPKHASRACLVGPVVQEGPGEAGDEVKSEVFDGQAVPNHHGDDIVHVAPVAISVANEELDQDLELQAAGFRSNAEQQARQPRLAVKVEFFAASA